MRITAREKLRPDLAKTESWGRSISSNIPISSHHWRHMGRRNHNSGRHISHPEALTSLNKWTFSYVIVGLRAVLWEILCSYLSKQMGLLQVTNRQCWLWFLPLKKRSQSLSLNTCQPTRKRVGLTIFLYGLWQSKTRLISTKRKKKCNPHEDLGESNYALISLSLSSSQYLQGKHKKT